KPEAPTPPKQHPGFSLRRWAWEDSNLRPHAYQPDRYGFRGFLAAGRIAENLDGTRNLHVGAGGRWVGCGGQLTPVIDTSILNTGDAGGFADANVPKYGDRQYRRVRIPIKTTEGFEWFKPNKCLPKGLLEFDMCP